MKQIDLVCILWLQTEAFRVNAKIARLHWSTGAPSCQGSPWSIFKNSTIHGFWMSKQYIRVTFTTWYHL